jgi:hypothetical protein
MSVEVRFNSNLGLQGVLNNAVWCRDYLLTSIFLDVARVPKKFVYSHWKVYIVCKFNIHKI